MDAHQTKIYAAILITALIIGCIFVYFILSLVAQQRRNSQLYKEKLLAEIRTLENERSRIAADLHDELGPLLFSVKFKISSLESTPEDQDDINKAHIYIDDIIQRLRAISNNLMPGTLVRKGMLLAIEEYIDSISKSASLKIRFTHDGIPDLPKEMAVNLYRLVMEVIHNTLKHARADHLNISIEKKGDLIKLAMDDNGIGFDSKTVMQHKNGLGLRSMLNRVEIMEGDMFIDAAPGKGTSYSIEIPLTKNNDPI